MTITYVQLANIPNMSVFWETTWEELSSFSYVMATSHLTDHSIIIHFHDPDPKVVERVIQAIKRNGLDVTILSEERA